MDQISKLKELSKEITYLRETQSLLGWDEEVMMPKDGGIARKQQKKTLSSIAHDKISSSELKDLLESIDEQNLTEENLAVYREIKKDHERSSKVSRDLVEEISEKSTETVQAWKEAREKDSFDIVKPHLSELVELKRKYAKQIDSEREPYEVLFEDFEPFLNLEKVEKELKYLKQELPKVYQKCEKSEPSQVEHNLTESEMKELCRELASSFTFDFDRGRLDTSEAPFTTGNQFDTRITTRFSEGLIESLLITAHETGHGLYQQGLPQEHYGTPLGTSRELSIHESQSRLWENHIGRSKQFWEFFSDKLSSKGVKRSPEELYQIANSVDDNNMVRVEADEISYNLHIVLRFELERKLVNGDLTVEELPEKWDEKMEEYLGHTPENDSEGCLQDIHWFYGEFGYFPTYSIGNILAAQIYSRAENEIPDLNQKIQNGRFKQLREWLKQNIHSKGRLKDTNEMAEELVDGIDAEVFVDYLKEKHL